MQRCPKCDVEIQSDWVNIKEGFALCDECGQLSRLSELRFSDVPLRAVLDNVPAGCTLIESPDGVEMTATLRSISLFMGLVAFALFWNSIVSVFVFVVAADFYVQLIGPLPEWFPAPLNEGGGQKGMGFGIALFVTVFLIPFVTVGLGLIWYCLMLLFGKTRVHIKEEDSYVTTGVGLLRLKRKFKTQEVRSVDLESRFEGENSVKKTAIKIVADRTIIFGDMIQEYRRDWIFAATRHYLLGNRK